MKNDQIINLKVKLDSYFPLLNFENFESLGFENVDMG